MKIQELFYEIKVIQNLLFHHQIISLMNKIIYTLKLFTNQQFLKKEFPFYPLT